MAAVLEFTDATVVRDGTPIVDAVNWTVDEAERWALLGPNGAGKTTLLQLAAAALHPSKGSVRVLGEQLGAIDVFELRPRVGLVSAAFADRMPAHEPVVDAVLTAAYAVVGRFRERYDSVDADRAAFLLDQLGAAHLSSRRYGTLSEGERKRVQIARSLMTDPELLLLDEPAGGLDLGAREELLARLGQLAQDETAPALVMVTHHVEEIPPGVTHAALVREGKMVAAGPVEQTLSEASLTACFGLDLVVERFGPRWSARAR